MSLWKRFIRAIKALFGGAIAAIEDPKLILEQNIREMNDQVPKMNENIATVKASVMLLEKEVASYRNQVNDLTSKIKAAIAQGREDIAGNYALQYERIKSSLAQSETQLASAQKAYQKALEVKEAFMRERERKINEAKEALRAHERAKWQSKIADTLQSFEVGGIDQTHDEMLRRVNEQTARNEAKMEMALDSVDTGGLKLEKEAEKIRAAELLKQFKMDMTGTDTGIGSNIDSNTSQQNRQRDSIL